MIYYSLLYLNDIVVSPNEKVKAINLHGADLENRRENHSKYVNGLEFKNYQYNIIYYRPPFCDDIDDNYPLYEDLQEFEKVKAVKLFARDVIKKCFDNTIELMKKISYQTCNSIN